MSKWEDWKGLATGEDKFVKAWHEQLDKSAKKETEWIRWLRRAHIKAAHPDDGWHERNKKRIRLAYPVFDDGVQVGDQIAIGNPNEFYVVTVLGTEKTLFGSLYYVYSYKRDE